MNFDRPLVTINGTLSHFSPPNPIEVDFDPTRGTVFRIKYRSAGDNLAGLANLFFNERVRFHWTRGVIVSDLEAEFSGGALGWSDAPQPNWQLLGNEQQKSIFDSDFAKGLGIGATSAAKRVFDACQSGDIDANQVQSEANGGIPTGPGAPVETFLGVSSVPVGFFTFLRFLLNGQTHFAQGQYVLKRTLTISNFFVGDLPGEAPETLLTTGEVLGFGMPVAIAAKVKQVPAGASHDNFLWSWRQLPSTMTTTANNRIEVSTEWWWDEWSTDLYATA